MAGSRGEHRGENMELWQSLVSTALMGTERQTPTVPAGEDALTTLVQTLDWQQPESALLAAAGAMALHRRVGQRPLSLDLPALEPCPLGDLPVCGDRSRRHLRTALESEPRVLPELLTLMAEAGQRVPELLLPKLLNWGKRQETIHPKVVAVLGERGRWLAAQNSNWNAAQSWAEGFDPESAEAQAVWQGGDRLERSQLLRRWRRVDADAARAALEAVWASELAKEREAFCAALAVGLSLGDEPFLEAALGDRAQGVRSCAMALLMRMLESRLCQRMGARSQRFVQITGKGSAREIRVTLPEKFEQDWAKDGIGKKSPQGKGQKAWWLEQLVAYTPLAVWNGGVDNEGPDAVARAIAQALPGHDWQEPLLLGWSQAARRQQNRVWAEVLIESFNLQEFDPEVLAELFELLPQQPCETLLQTKLPTASAKPKLLGQWLALVSHCERNWSLAFSQLVLEQLIGMMRVQRRDRYQLSCWLDDLALVLDPAMATVLEEAIATLPPDPPNAYDTNLFQRAHSRLKFRQAIHNAFNPSG